MLKRLRIGDLEIDKPLSTSWWSSGFSSCSFRSLPSRDYRCFFPGLYDFVKGGFYRCINNVVSYVWVVAPDAPFEWITEASVMAKFLRH